MRSLGEKLSLEREGPGPSLKHLPTRGSSQDARVGGSQSRPQREVAPGSHGTFQGVGLVLTFPGELGALTPTPESGQRRPGREGKPVRVRDFPGCRETCSLQVGVSPDSTAAPFFVQRLLGGPGRKWRDLLKRILDKVVRTRALGVAFQQIHLPLNRVSPAALGPTQLCRQPTECPLTASSVPP